MTTDALIIKGDCLNVMAGLPAASIDAIVTDPPYGLSFMGKDWDKGVPGESFWREALRVAKPGCHILAAGGSRTYHRLAVAIEDAGWEIRDCVMWIYGSGFPKSHDVSKAIDREAGAEREVVGKSSRHVSGKPEQRTAGLAGSSTFAETVGMGAFLTAPATDAARQWQGWGTALKPAFEPFILARKPLDGTVANNVQRHGCGGLNVDGCRVGCTGESLRGGGVGSCSEGWDRPWKADAAAVAAHKAKCDVNADRASTLGRWPANVIHDGSDEVMAVFPNSGNGSGLPKIANRARNKGWANSSPGVGVEAIDNYGDSGSAARFFYCAKASPSEREEGLNGLEDVKAGSYKLKTDAHSDRNGLTTAPRTNHHPTVKPVDLMKYLCRLITPPGGLILDPFCGSGSTGVAAMRERFNFIGIELNADYAEIARRRIDHERNKTPLFSNVI